MQSKYDCLALFSGGLDSVLACKTIQAQGLRVLGLHFISPFFGGQDKAERWQSLYGIDILPVDIGPEFVDMLLAGPRFGLGKHLNPCIDCKIFMLRRAKELLHSFQAEFLLSGEVAGQRPMSQRRDALRSIRREAGVEDLLLRPLSAGILAPTPMEERGLVDRSRLHSLQGRGRKPQLRLAREFALPEIPTPAGGCLLTDPESVRRFAPVLHWLGRPTARDFELAGLGRQYWRDSHWLIIGRNKNDNARLIQVVDQADVVFKIADHPGPVAIGRQLQGEWPQEVIESAARWLTGFSNKARKSGGPVRVKVGRDGNIADLMIDPEAQAGDDWQEPDQDLLPEVKTALRAGAASSAARSDGRSTSS